MLYNRLILSSFFLLVVTFLCCGFIVKNNHLPFIEIKYVGPSNKPLLSVVLYTDDTFDTTSTVFTYFIKVSKNDFDSIGLYIDNNTCIKGIDRRSIHFRMSLFEYGLSGFILTTNKTSSEKEVAHMLSFLTDDRVRKKIKKVLDPIVEATP